MLGSIVCNFDNYQEQIFKNASACLHYGVASAFARLLADMIPYRQQAAFARRAGTSKGNLSHVLSEFRKPPLKTIDKWADALDLVGDQRDNFIDLAHLAHAPDRVQRIVQRLSDKVDLLEDLLIRRENRAAEPLVAFTTQAPGPLDQGINAPLKPQGVAGDRAPRGGPK